MIRDTCGQIGLVAGPILTIGAAVGLFAGVNIVIGALLLVGGAAILKVGPAR
jgi:hypothetical protein